MPGVGVRTAARILTGLVGKNFKDAAPLASYAGIALATHRTDVLYTMLRDGALYTEPTPPTVTLAA